MKFGRKMKKVLSVAVAAGLSLGVFAGINDDAFAATRPELAKISVNKAGSNFKYWNENAVPKKKLVDYVKDVTDKKSKNFIPVEDRIAVFDLDGTLICETAPCYFEWMMYLERALNDPSYQPSQADKEYAQVVKEAIYAHAIPEDMEGKEARSQASVFAGMTLDEYDEFVKKFMSTEPEGMANLKWGEAFFMPMVEVVSYLRANDFTVYIVSGSDRQALRILVDGIMDIKPNNIIGTDIMTLASGQGDTDGLEYKFQTNKDILVRGQFTLKNVKMNKVSNIAREIGKQPVLSFGNSSGDASMHNYTISQNKYKSLAFALCCDDLMRDHGNIAKADKMKATCEKEGWIAVSMRDDWKTIYGDNVVRLDR